MDLNRFFSFTKSHMLIIAIVALAAWLRVWQLDTLGIFFGDAGHDIISAIEAVKDKTIPLLGIESSVPRFRQGPVTVWLHMVIHLGAGARLYWHWLVFALLGIAAVIAVYELCQLYFSPRMALLASFLVAVSPLAVAHSRMAYHITPIPLILVFFLAATIRLAQQKKHSLFWAVLAWAGLFQFELALAPLILVIMYYIVIQKQWRSLATYKQLGLGLFIGLLPQIVFDITHKFSHLGGFTVWVIYRIVSLAPTGKHSFSLDTFITVGEAFGHYWGRIISFDQPWITAGLMAAVVFTIYFAFLQYRQKKLSDGMIVTISSTFILSLAFLLHGGPSEAYFPPFIVLLPLIVAYAIDSLPPKMMRLAVVAVVVLGFFNIHQIIKHNFFVSTSHPFSYSYGIDEQQQIISYLANQYPQGFYFVTTQTGGVFPNFFDNLRVLTWQQGLTENTETGQAIFIETKDSSLQSYPGAIKTTFPSVDVYQLL
jgi:hypothetical protein